MHLLKLMKTTRLLSALCAFLILGLGVCAQAADKQLTIAVVPKATTHSYWKAAEAGARKAAQELNVKLEWQGPLDDSKIADQIGIFNNLAASGVDGVVLAPCDDK